MKTRPELELNKFKLDKFRSMASHFFETNKKMPHF